MANKMIGVEFGSNTLKMAVCSGDQVKKMAVAKMPEDLVREGRVTSPAAMTQFLKDMMKENGIRGGNCAMVLPASLVLGHHVSMPAMSHNELMLNLPFEFRDFVGKDGAKFDYDYSVMGIHDNIMELYAAAVRKDLQEGRPEPEDRHPRRNGLVQPDRQCPQPAQEAVRCGHRPQYHPGQHLRGRQLRHGQGYRHGRCSAGSDHR